MHRDALAAAIRGQRPRKVQRMHVKALAVLHRLEIDVAPEMRANLLARPERHVLIQRLVEMGDAPLQRRAIVMPEHLQPAHDRVDAEAGIASRKGPHRLAPGIRQGKQTARVLASEPRLDRVQPVGESDGHETAVASRCRAPDAAPFQQHHRLAGIGQPSRRPQAGEAAPDNGHVTFAITLEPAFAGPGARGCRVETFGVVETPVMVRSYTHGLCVKPRAERLEVRFRASAMRKNRCSVCS